MKKIFICFMLIMLNSFPAFCADINSIEREGLILRVQLNRLGNNGDPFEREEILQRIIDTCKGTEEGENAYWDLADLYLDGFPEEMRQEAREILELCLRAYPNSNRASMVKFRLIDLYDAGDSRRSELVRQLKNDKNIPAMLRNSIN